MCEAITSDVGATLILFAASIFVFILFVASYSQRGTWLALCSMSTTMVLGCLFISTVHDHSQVHMRFAWVASELPQLPDWQFAGDVASAFEHLAIFRRCKIGQQGCNAAASAASLPMKDVVKQPAAAETKPAWRLTDDDRDYLIKTIAFEASGEPAMAKIAVAYVVLSSKAASNIAFYLGVLRASAGASYVPGAYICGLPRGVQHYLQMDVFRP